MRLLVCLCLLVCVPCFFAVEQEHVCIHEQILKQKRTRDPSESFTHVPSRRTDPFEDGEGLRILVEPTLLNSDPYMCTSVGQCLALNSPSGTCDNNRCTSYCIGYGCDACFYKCSEQDVMTAAKKTYVLNELMPDAVAFFQKALSPIYKPTGNLKSHYSDCGGSDVPIPTYLRSAGVGSPSTDLVIILTARPAGGSTIAYASACDWDSYGRPIFGHVNFSPEKLDTVSSAMEKMVAVTVHEMTHVVGFSSSMYSSYKDQDNSFTKWPSVRVSGTQVDGALSHLVEFIGTRSVKFAAQKHFNCSDLPGAELENFGSSGTAGVHWEKRVFYNEFMTGTSSKHPVFSNITMALFYDMGWYHVNFTHGQQLVWGHNLGCGFAEDRCSDASWRFATDVYNPTAGQDNAYKCGFVTGTNKGEPCVFDRSAKGFCNVMKYTASLPSWYAYYSDKTLGGLESSDFCGFYIPFSDMHECGIAENYHNDPLASLMGEAYGTSSRCMQSTLASRLIDAEAPDVPRPGCYEYQCRAHNELFVKVDGTFYSCRRDGGPIKITGYNGDLYCPPTAQMCEDIDNSFRFGGVRRAEEGYTTTGYFPTILSVTPDSGSIIGNFDLAIEGMHFNYTSGEDGEVVVNSVAVGRVPCDIRSVNDTHIICHMSPFKYATAEQTPANIVVRNTIGRQGDGIRLFLFEAASVKAAAGVLLPCATLLFSLLLLFA